MTVEDIVKKHWAIYGRNYYSRYDYENLDTDSANKIFALLNDNMAVFEKASPGNKARDFEYVDPIDGSVSKHQGFIFAYPDGSRFVFRRSGTGTVGATIRIYLEKYSAEKLDLATVDALKDIAVDALKYSQIHEISKRDKPTVIT